MSKKDIYLILAGIRSAYNFRSIFRTADGAGVTKMYLCGISPTPNDTKVVKTSLGTEKTLPWDYHKQIGRLIKKLKNEGVQIIALEQSKQSIDYTKFKPKFPLAIIVGNEVSGLNKKVLSCADVVIEIPMRGEKESLNVAVATGIALFQIITH